MADMVLRRFICIMSLNPNVMSWQVDVISPFFSSEATERERELYVFQPKLHSKWQRI